MEAAKGTPDNKHENLEQDIKSVVEAGHYIRENVRAITLKALGEGKLDIKEIAQVTKSVIKGASSGATHHELETKSRLSKALAGLDDALCSAAEASKLAIEEANGQIKTFTKENLKQAIADLGKLENIYLDTLTEAVQEANETVSQTLNDLLEHGRICGTAVGRRATEIIKLLHHDLKGSLKETVTTGADSALQLTSNIAYAAAGFLNAIAQTLEAKSKPTASKHDKQ